MPIKTDWLLFVYLPLSHFAHHPLADTVPVKWPPRIGGCVCPHKAPRFRPRDARGCGYRMDGNELRHIAGNAAFGNAAPNH